VDKCVLYCLFKCFCYWHWYMCFNYVSFSDSISVSFF
jgi:hypothetical protein